MSDGDLEYLEERPSPDGGGRLGRSVLWHDPQNRRFAAVGSVVRGDASIRPKSWWARHLFDQNPFPRCTAEAAVGALFTSPNRLILPRENLTRYDAPDERQALYLAAQKVDPWPGEAYDGSSTDAPLKVLRDLGYIGEWRWCFGLDDVLLTLSNHGPVIWGTWWKTGQDQPRGIDGLVTYSGSNRGGHAYLNYGWGLDDRYEGGGYLDYLQTWGLWGPRRGRFRMSLADGRRALEDQGEAVTIVLPEGV